MLSRNMTCIIFNQCYSATFEMQYSMEMERKTEKKHAKLCYEHIGGKLGNLLFEAFVAKGWLAKEELGQKDFYITEVGLQKFKNLGIDLSQIKS